jgi:hypothetical protein
VTLGVGLPESSHGVPRLLLASFKFRSFRRDVRRRDARHQFSNVVSSGMPRLTCAQYGVFWRRRFFRAVFNGYTWRLLEASQWQASRCFASVFQSLVQWHPEVHLCQIWRLVAASPRPASVFVTSSPLTSLGSSALKIVMWRRRDHSRRDARRRFFNLFSNDIPWIIGSKYGVLWCRRDAWRRFSSVMSNVILRFTCAKYNVFSDVTKSRGTRRRFSVVSSVIPGSFSLKWRNLASWRPNVRRRFFTSVVHCVPKLLLASIAFRSRRHDDWRRDA